MATQPIVGLPHRLRPAGDGGVERLGCGRFVVTVAPDNQKAFESLFAKQPAACVGQVTETPQLKITGQDGKGIVDVTVDRMKSAWKGPFGDLI